MITPMLIQLFETDLNKLSAAINLYKDEESVWLVKEGMKISGGNQLNYHGQIDYHRDLSGSLVFAAI